MENLMLRRRILLNTIKRLELFLSKEIKSMKLQLTPSWSKRMSAQQILKDTCKQYNTTRLLKRAVLNHIRLNYYLDKQNHQKVVNAFQNRQKISNVKKLQLRIPKLPKVFNLANSKTQNHKISTRSLRTILLDLKIRFIKLT